MDLLSAEWVVPGAGPPIRDGLAAVEDGRIAWVGGRGAAGRPAGAVRDLGRGVLLPGLVNAHTHLELSYLRDEISPERDFVTWIRAVVAARRQQTQPDAPEVIESLEAALAAKRAA